MELEEAIKLLEEKIEKGKELDTRNNPMSDIIDEIIIENKAIETVLHYIKEESMPKAVVKEEIKKLDKTYKEMKETSDFIIADTIQPKIEVLQEILIKGELNVQNNK